MINLSDRIAFLFICSLIIFDHKLKWNAPDLQESHENFQDICLQDLERVRTGPYNFLGQLEWTKWYTHFINTKYTTLWVMGSKNGPGKMMYGDRERSALSVALFALWLVASDVWHLRIEEDWPWTNTLCSEVKWPMWADSVRPAQNVYEKCIKKHQFMK